MNLSEGFLDSKYDEGRNKMRNASRYVLFREMTVFWMHLASLVLDVGYIFISAKFYVSGFPVYNTLRKILYLLFMSIKTVNISRGELHYCR